MYAHTSGPNSDTLNIELLELLTRKLSATRLPFIMGGLESQSHGLEPDWVPDPFEGGGRVPGASDLRLG